MNNLEMSLAICFIRPNSEFTVIGDELTWLDKNQIKPTKTEIEAGWIAYQAAKAIEAQANAEAKSALLSKLGITEDEAKSLLN